MKLKDLEEMSLWVCWQTEERGDKETKIPHSALGNGLAKSNDSKTWGTRSQAEEAARRLPKPRGTAGVGIMLTAIPGTTLRLGGVDLDACLDELKITPWALEIIQRFATYTEVSPSQTGVKLFFLYDSAKMEGIKGKTARRKGAGKGGKDPAIEFYVSGRYFAVTDRGVKGFDEFREVSRADLEWLVDKAIPAFKGEKKKEKKKENEDINVETVASAFDIISNDTMSWEDWNNRGMAIFAATKGSDEGFAIFDKWSRKSDRYDEAVTKERWEHFKGSPPDRSTIGSIIFWAREEDRDWVPPHSAAAGAFARGKPKKDEQVGPVLPVQGNYRLALAKLGVQLSYNEFNHRYMVQGPGERPMRHLDDASQDNLYLTIDEKWHFRSNLEFFVRFLKNEARENTFHPVKEYLDELEWDGVPRLDTWLIRIAGVKDSEYTRAISRLFLTAAVRRVRSPGCKFDEMLVLESEQGFDKSSALAALAVKPEWFSDSLPLNADERQVVEMVEGKWILEIAELKGIRQGEIEHLKSFLSRQYDRARKAYDREHSELARQCVFMGTTNSAAYLLDITGNRRFWPFRITRFDIAMLLAERDQLWAEAATAEASGESIRLSPHLYAAAAAEQEERVVDEPWVPVVEKAMNGYAYGKILSADVWDLIGILPGMRTQTHSARLGETMRHMGWERAKLNDGHGTKKWHYAKGTLAERSRRITVARDEHGFPVVEAEEDMQARTEEGPPIDDDIPFPE